MYDIRESYIAHSVDEALEMLSVHSDALLVAGGTDVLIKVRERKLKQAVLVSILGIPELKTITLDTDGTIRIGSGCNFTQITDDPIILEKIPMLAAACRQVGSPQIRNVATIGGNICNGAVSADSVSPLMALDAELVLASKNGEHIVPIRTFHTGPGKTIRDRAEVLTEIRIPRQSYDGHGGCYIKFGQRKAMEIATLGCAVNVSLEDDARHLRSAAIAYSVAAPTPARCPKTEALLTGMEIGPELWKTARANVLTELQPRDSWRASLELREQLIKELVVRALKEAVRRAGGEVD